LIVRVDRTDPSKNIVRGFHAFELLLERHPEWRGRVSMLALLDPSREQVPEYVAYRDETERAVRAVNDRFGRPGWQPVDLRIEDDFLQSVAAYKQYDVLLVNAVYDGMNLVAKEGPLVNTLDGVLVLSENTGAYDELGEWALGVSPFDVLGQAEALHAALSMDGAERRRRAEALRAHMRRNDAAGWLRDLLADVDATGRA
jgi:trehalose 6-phosphate synthase